MPKVSIIILTYNSEKYIEKLVKSIYQFNTGQNFETIIVDNNSKDKTVSTAHKFGEKVRVYETGANLGFAKGINYGAGRASGDFLLLVNPDAVWHKGKISDFLHILEKDKNIGIVGGKMLSINGVLEKSAGKFYGFWTSFITALGFDEALGIRFSPDKIQKVDSVSGGFMLVKKGVFEKLQGFDEHYFMYIEDSDLCFRAKKKGIITYFTPDVALIHQGQGSSNKAFAFKNIIKGILYFQIKHVSYFSYIFIKFMFYTKAAILVLFGKILNNKTLVDNYIDVLKV